MRHCETLQRALTASGGDREKTGKVVSRSFYKLLRRNGFTHPDIMDVAGYLLDEVMKDIRTAGKDRKRPVEIKPAAAQSEEVA